MPALLKEVKPVKGRVVVAMSGGVDSSVAAALLIDEGWEVIGMTLRLWDEERPELPAMPSRSCCAWESVTDARQVAASLGIDHYVINMKEQFRRDVVEYFIREYRDGRTPNPCIACNREIKFSALLQKALELEAAHLATGHYARAGYSEARGRYLLQKGVDAWKDQSYMLYELTQEQLRRCLFPLGGLTKQEVRRKAETLGLGVAHKQESQEICFVPDNDYRAFLRRSGVKAAPGPIVDRAGRRLGTHKGTAFYTVGQRRGLGLTAPRPLYVLEIRPAENTLVVGERAALDEAGLELEAVNLVALGRLEKAEEVTVKIRYRAPEVPAVVLPPDGAGAVRLLFKEPQPAVAPGQAAVFYQDDLLLGGGTIKTAVKQTGV
jgi:tRNA-uridine 2-sulfurtransferase